MSKSRIQYSRTLLAIGLVATFVNGAQAAPAMETNPALTADTTAASRAPAAEPAHRWSFYWGWNRSSYSNSDIHFTGVDHDFTLSQVKAHDTQTSINLDNVIHTFLNPLRITIPQTNARLAYQYDKDTAFALNLDHMKYVMTSYQVTPIDGTINGVVQSGNQNISPEFLKYEHTDGLNILSLEAEKQLPVDLFGPAVPTRLFGLTGLGVVVPKSNVTLGFANQPRNDQFHIAGYSAHVGLGIEADLSSRFFVRTAGKFGYVNLPDVWTSARHDKASQKFNYSELILAAGVRF